MTNPHAIPKGKSYHTPDVEFATREAKRLGGTVRRYVCQRGYCTYHEFGVFGPQGFMLMEVPTE